MRTLLSELEILDLTLTQAIDKYLEMEPDEICTAITTEWPEQIAVILTAFLFNTACVWPVRRPRPVYLQRKNGLSHYITFLSGGLIKPSIGDR